MKKVNMKSIQSVLLLGLSLVFLTNCSSLNRSHLGAGLGGTTTTAVCVESGVSDPYLIAGCAVVGAFAGANVMYKSDYDVHNAVFVLGMALAANHANANENKSVTPKEFVTAVSEVPGKVGNFLTNEVEKTKEYQKKSWAEMKTKWPFTMFNKN